MSIEYNPDLKPAIDKELVNIAHSPKPAKALQAIVNRLKDQFPAYEIKIHKAKDVVKVQVEFIENLSHYDRKETLTGILENYTIRFEFEETTF